MRSTHPAGFLEKPVFDGLQGAAEFVVKGVVQQKDVVGSIVDQRQLAAELLERMRTQTASDERPQVLGTHVDFNRPICLEGIGDISHRPQVVANGASA